MVTGNKIPSRNQKKPPTTPGNLSSPSAPKGKGGKWPMMGKRK